MNNKNIVILGATGFTANIISNLFIKENINFLPAGRNIKKINELYNPNKYKPEEVDIFSEKSINNLLLKTDILINCIGPYNFYGKKILELSAKHKLIYIDISGEQEYIYHSFNNLHKIAKKNNSTIIHSVAFESYIAEILACKIINPKKSYNNISSFYYFEKNKISPGTRLTMKIKQFYDTFIFNDNKLIKAKSFEYNKKINFEYTPEIKNASFIPYPEVLFFSNQYKSRNVGSYLIVDEFDIKIFHNQKKTNTTNIEEIIRAENKQKKRIYNLKQRERQKFYVLVNSIDAKGRQNNICAKGNDGYGLTAHLVVEFVKEILKIKNIPSGVFSPTSIIKTENIIKNIQEKTNLTLEKTDFVCHSVIDN